MSLDVLIYFDCFLLVENVLSLTKNQVLVAQTPSKTITLLPPE